MPVTWDVEKGMPEELGPEAGWEGVEVESLEELASKEEAVQWLPED